MGVGWIDRIYNNTDNRWWWTSVDTSHNGRIVNSKDGSSYDVGYLGATSWHQIDARTMYYAEWCGIPWYYVGGHYKALTFDKYKSVQFWTSQVGGTNYIQFIDAMTGRNFARQEAPKGVDFHCFLRFEDDGNYLDVVNDDGTTKDTLTEINDQARSWIQVLAPILAAAVKGAGGG